MISQTDFEALSNGDLRNQDHRGILADWFEDAGMIQAGAFIRDLPALLNPISQSYHQLIDVGRLQPRWLSIVPITRPLSTWTWGWDWTSCLPGHPMYDRPATERRGMRPNPHPTWFMSALPCQVSGIEGAFQVLFELDQHYSLAIGRCILAMLDLREVQLRKGLYDATTTEMLLFV